MAFGVVVEFERRSDQTRRAQTVIAQMRNQEGEVLAAAFRPATGATADLAAAQARSAAELAQAKDLFNSSLVSLERLGNSDAPAEIRAMIRTDFEFIDRIAALVGRDDSRTAALELGRSEAQGGLRANLAATFSRADASYGAKASRARTVALIGTGASILFLLTAFSLTYYHSARARRRSHDEAMTDALTGIGNRRKLFADLERAVDSLEDNRTLALGIFDLDGFKAYNDTFGHPAGDALLARLGHRLVTATGPSCDAYRIGGDEFVIVTAAADSERLLSAAQAALSDHGAGFVIGCSRGSTHIQTGVTPEQALHVADQRLYANKRSVRRLHIGAKDVLLQVLAEQDIGLVDHLGHVAKLAEMTAIGLGLPPDEVERARLAAELHDVGKAAIPSSILDKPGPLDPAERALMERHSLIGERILATAPTLAGIAPIVRSTHERPDGKGYPDGLLLDEIPICSRIIAVVDAFAAMTSDRPYQRALPTDAALAELHQCAGTQFDPDVVEAFATVLEAAPEARAA
jgi:two-component system, cell cycle response regulator